MKRTQSIKWVESTEILALCETATPSEQRRLIGVLESRGTGWAAFFRKRYRLDKNSKPLALPSTPPELERGIHDLAEAALDNDISREAYYKALGAPNPGETAKARHRGVEESVALENDAIAWAIR